ncbi:hypothetical protein PITC_063910 [Penicillium italicum]|uniref:Uncharacterized protein n=1 Tax=Penicillium italicum TaxID=40296 RepID=A0A0A2KL14_PENIT|nr:hypothetical protein PITC_063910 [Penicillium italicum]
MKLCGVSRLRTHVAEVVWTSPGKLNNYVVSGGRLLISSICCGFRYSGSILILFHRGHRRKW